MRYVKEIWVNIMIHKIIEIIIVAVTNNILYYIEKYAAKFISQAQS